MLRSCDPQQSSPLPLIGQLALGSRLARNIHQPVFIVFLAAWLTMIGACLLGLDPVRAWPYAPQFLLFAATAATLTGLARVLPWQNVLAAAGLIGASGAGLEILAYVTGLPFGARSPQLAGDHVALIAVWWLPLGWINILISARGVARLTLRPWREIRFYGWWLILGSALLAATFDLAWQELNTGLNSGLGPGVIRPLSFLLLKAGLAFGVMTLAAPWFIDKHPSRYKQNPDFHPVILWMAFTILLAADYPSGPRRAATLCFFLASQAVLVLAIIYARAQRPPEQ